MMIFNKCLCAVALTVFSIDAFQKYSYLSGLCFLAAGAIMALPPATQVGKTGKSKIFAGNCIIVLFFCIVGVAARVFNNRPVQITEGPISINLPKKPHVSHKKDSPVFKEIHTGSK